jgi:hypothetical protein
MIFHAFTSHPSMTYTHAEELNELNGDILNTSIYYSVNIPI